MLQPNFEQTAGSQTTRSLERFDSGGFEVRIETFAEPARQSAPSIIVLHGATGVEFANRFIATLAESFAVQGFVVHLVHYFDRTGARYADEATIQRSSGEWLITIHDAVAFVRHKRPQAAIGFFGYSLGGYLAAAETVSNNAVGAAVILSGGLDEDSARTARRAAPVLILHGEADSRVPVSEARRLEAVLKRAGHAPEVRIYPDEGHIMTPRTYADVMARSARFLHKNLKKESR